MAKLYTRKGDDGGTILCDGTRVSKDDTRVEAYGLIDELNAHLGLAACLLPQRGGDPALIALHERLVHIQNEVFAVGAELATPAEAQHPDKTPAVATEQASRLETWIDEATSAVPPLRAFVLPRGDPLASQLHVCRAVCRRAERRVVALAAEARINPQVLVYLNRLSDLLFAWARLANHLAGIADEPWIKPTQEPPA